MQSTNDIVSLQNILRDTHKDNTTSKKTEALKKSIYMYIQVIGTLNQLFIRGSHTQIIKKKKKKNEVVSYKNPFFAIISFCTLHSTCLNIGF